MTDVPMGHDHGPEQVLVAISEISGHPHADVAAAFADAEERKPVRRFLGGKSARHRLFAGTEDPEAVWAFMTRLAET